jgi:molybdopterin-guanine dinucleotide biosynthesis protein
MQRLLIVGGQNSGKTTLLKHIAHQRSLTGSVLILDSHNHAGKWSDKYRIVGHGRDYAAIETELHNLGCN